MADSDDDDDDDDDDNDDDDDYDDDNCPPGCHCSPKVLQCSDQGENKHQEPPPWILDLTGLG